MVVINLSNVIIRLGYIRAVENCRSFPIENVVLFKILKGIEKVRKKNIFPPLLF